MNSIVAVLSGIICGLSIWFLGLMVFTSLYPYPSDIDLSDRTSFQSFIQMLPTKAYVIKILFNCMSVITAGLVASIIGKKLRFQSGLLAGLPFLVYFIVHDFTYTYPTFFVVTDICLSALLGFIAIYYGGSRNISD